VSSLYSNRTVPILFLLLSLCGCGRKFVDKTPDKPQEPPRYGFVEENFIEVITEIKDNETFFGLLGRLGVPSEMHYPILHECDSVFDVRKMRTRQKTVAYYEASDTLHTGCPEFIVYHKDIVNKTVFHCKDSLFVRPVQLPVEHITKKADVTISSSLWNDMLASGASPLLILKLSDIYAWTVDFFGLQEGDRFRLIYSQSLCENEIISVDTVYYAVFTRDQKDLCSIMYDQGDGGNIYWNEKGESMRKAFLKAPLHFNRISSGFSYRRKHPVSGKVKAHTGVDYAAPVGTPVHSIGDGTVISVGWAGGGGKTVKIRHNSVYTTAYLHLSRFANGLHSGQRVRQGEVIGYVGSTGTSTGPHLDFRVWMNGSPINPLKMESPPEGPIKEENLPDLDSTYRYFKAMMEE